MTKLQSSKICCVDQMNHFVQDLFCILTGALVISRSWSTLSKMRLLHLFTF